MTKKKIYTDPAKYEEKLGRVMKRLNIEEFSFDYSRHQAWISFVYKGQPYHFEQSVEKAREHGIDLNYGSDAFAQLVLSLEDLSRMVERGIYDLNVWIAGMKALPVGNPIAECFTILGFHDIPKSQEELRSQYRTLLKRAHPDQGGSQEELQKVRDAYEQAKSLLINSD